MLVKWTSVLQDVSQHNYVNGHQQVIVKENTNTVFVNREKILIQKQSSEESSDSLKPLLNSEEETVAAVQSSSMTYNSITSSRSSTSTSSSGSPVTKLFPNTCTINMPDQNRKVSDNSTFNEAIENYLTPLSVAYTPPVAAPPLHLPLTSAPRIETKAIVHNTSQN